MTRILLQASAALLTMLFIVGCGSLEDTTEQKRQKLLQMYPVQKTQRGDIEKRFGHPPQERVSRPQTGWETLSDWRVRTYAINAETRTGKRIESLDRYFGNHGFSALCYCWFYYDKNGRLMDADWQWSSN